MSSSASPLQASEVQPNPAERPRLIPSRSAPWMGPALRCPWPARKSVVPPCAKNSSLIAIGEKWFSNGGRRWTPAERMSDLSKPPYSKKTKKKKPLPGILGVVQFTLCPQEGSFGTTWMLTLPSRGMQENCFGTSRLPKITGQFFYFLFSASFSPNLECFI